MLQDYSVLPSLKVSDIEVRESFVKSDEIDINGTKVCFFENCPDGVTFLRVKLNTKNIDSSLTQFLFLFESFLPQLGTKSFSYDEFKELIFLNTGKFNINIQAQASPLDPKEPNGYFLLTIACLDKNIETMFNLITELLTEPNFKDYTQLSRLIRLESSELASNFDNYGYCRNHSAVSLSRPLASYPSLANTRFLCKFGTNFLKATMNLRHQCEALEDSLTFILQKLMRKDNMKLLIHSHDKNRQYLEMRLNVMVDTMSRVYPHFDDQSEQVRIDVTEWEPEYIKEFFVIPSQVNYVSESFKIPHYLNPDASKLHILGEVLSNGALHNLIREKGGAYGSGCTVDVWNGVMTFSSYRDPKNLETYQNFEKAIVMIAEGQFK